MWKILVFSIAICNLFAKLKELNLLQPTHRTMLVAVQKRQTKMKAFSFPLCFPLRYPSGRHFGKKLERPWRVSLCSYNTNGATRAIVTLPWPSDPDCVQKKPTVISTSSDSNHELHSQNWYHHRKACLDNMLLRIDQTDRCVFGLIETICLNAETSMKPCGITSNKC